MSESLVSVVIPTFNRERHITHAIQSVLNQTYPHYEILVVNDGSTDGSREKILAIAQQDSRVRYFEQPNQGVSAARNRGMAEAKGEYLAFLDSDDEWLPRKLELQLDCLKMIPEAGMIWSDMEAVDADSGKTLFPRYLKRMYRCYRWFPLAQDLFSKAYELVERLPRFANDFSPDTRIYSGDLFSPMVLGNLVHTSTVLLTRERAKAVGPFTREFQRGGEDYEYHLKTASLGPVAFVDVVTIKYRIGALDAITRPENNVAMANAFITTLTRTLEKYRNQIKLSPQLISRVRGDAFAWLAREYLATNEVAQARRYFGKALRTWFWQPAQFKYVLVSLLPTWIIRVLPRHYATDRFSDGGMH